MPRQIVECVPNFSEGRDPAVLDAIARAVLSIPEVALLDHVSDWDHHRSVFTFAGPPGPVGEAAFRAVEAAVSLIDLSKHQGAHPRIGRVPVPIGAPDVEFTTMFVPPPWLMRRSDCGNPPAGRSA